MEKQDTTILKPDSLVQINSEESADQKLDSESVIILKDESLSQGMEINPPAIIRDPEPVENAVFESTLYQFDARELSDDNHLYFLEKTEDQFYYVEDSAELVYLKNPDQSLVAAESRTRQESLSDLKTEQLIKPDWLIAIIIGCLVLFAWLKLFYNKFIDQTFISLWNFQLSENFLRDQSIFSRRVATLLNINFIITSGLFFYLVAIFFSINPWSLNPIQIYLATTAIIALMLVLRYIISHLTGIIFNYHKLFKDYLSQILIIYKIAGIVLIPIIMAVAYLPDNLRIYLIITGLVMLSAGVLFRFVKGIQLIFNKDLSIFYLILYLCTLEILPVLVIYKFFSSLV